MAISKVIFNGQTLMDDTGNTVTADKVLNGYLAKGADGEQVEGTVVTASPYTSNPNMDGTASPGSSDNYSRGDHTHPTDTGRQAKITANGILKGNGSGTVSAATAGTDYQAPLPSQTGNSGKYLTTNGSALSWGSVSVPSATSTSPKMDGTATVGTETAWAKGDHIHPTDTSRQATITASGILKGDGAGGVTAATSGTDYAAASHSHGNITSGGDITATAPTIANGDQIVINDNSASKITNGPTFDGSTTTKALTPKGTWETFIQSHQSLSGYVPTSRTINSKALTSDITLTASDVGALADSTTIPSATSTSPKMDGTATVGSETTWAKGDHIHPTDTSRQAKITASGMLKGDGNGGVTAAVAGTDYIASHQDISGKANKTTITTGTLTATSWSGSTYSALQTTYPAATYDIEIEPNGDSCTAAQYAAWGAAQLVGSATTNVLTALGTVPTVNIPITIKVTAK